MMSSNDWEETIESQLSDLEKRVYGDLDRNNTPKNCTEILLNINSRLNLSTGGREKIAGLLKRYEEIEKCVNVEYGDVHLPDTAKIQLILSEDRNIKKIYQQLQHLQDMKTMLNSEHIKSAPALNDRLLQLSEYHFQQKEQADKQSQDTQALFESYNAIINTLTKQFVYWDDMITKMEIQSQTKKQ